METLHPPNLVVEAVETAEARLRSRRTLTPFIITERLLETIEEFEGGDPAPGQARFREFLHAAAGDEHRALVFVDHTDRGEDAIVIEHGQAGRQEAEVFVQRFRPRRRPLRGFKLLGEPTPVDEIGGAR
jgi:hypothetical protein